jgi:hydroxyquinol 1,2-dioxygenase
LFVNCTVTVLDRAPLVDASVDAWQADDDGFYDLQYKNLAQPRARGVLHTDAQGRFSFKSILPVADSIPADGPVGQLLVASGRHPWRPAHHVHFMIQAAGYETLITHVFRAGDAGLDSDLVFGVRTSVVMVSDFKAHAAGCGPWAAKTSRAHHTPDFDFVLNPRA